MGWCYVELIVVEGKGHISFKVLSFTVLFSNFQLQKN